MISEEKNVIEAQFFKQDRNTKKVDQKLDDANSLTIQTYSPFKAIVINN